VAWDDGLDDVPWASLTHAYGPATDVPGLLRLLAHTDPEVRRTADWELNGNVVHQGTTYAATAPACRFLARMAVELPHARFIATTFLAYVAGLGDEAASAEGAAAVAPLAAVADGPAEVGAVLALAAASGEVGPVVELAVEAEDEPELKGLAALVLLQVPEEAWRLAELRLHLVPDHQDLHVDPSEGRRAEILARHLGQ
jgi:hypothetical protein